MTEVNFRLCNLSGHSHDVPAEYTNCYEEMWDKATPEEKASWKETALRSMRKYREGIETGQ